MSQQRLPQPPPAKDRHNPHEGSADEALAVPDRPHQTQGGGYRSGSRGAGTHEEGGDKPTPRQGPGAHGGVHAWP